MKLFKQVAFVVAMFGIAYIHNVVAGDANHDYNWYVRANSNHVDWHWAYHTLRAGNYSPADSTRYNTPVDPNLVRHIRTGYGLTILMAAAAVNGSYNPLPDGWDRANLIRELIKAGADVNSKIDQSQNTGGWGYSADQLKNWTALNFAIQRGDDAAIAALGGIFLPNDQLQYALVKGDLNKVKGAIYSGADQEGINARTGNDGKNALALAVSKGDKDLVKLLIERGADPKIGNVKTLTSNSDILDILDPQRVRDREQQAAQQAAARAAEEQAAAERRAAAERAAAERAAAEQNAAKAEAEAEKASEEAVAQPQPEEPASTNPETTTSPEQPQDQSSEKKPAAPSVKKRAVPKKQYKPGDIVQRRGSSGPRR